MNRAFKQINALVNKIKKRFIDHINKEKAYIKKLLFPLKLFPLKILIYFIYYPIRISYLLIKWLVKSTLLAIIWPFRKWSNLFKTIIGFVLFIYLLFSVVVILDYMKRTYGDPFKFLCGFGVNKTLANSVVRVVGGYSQGSGFFIDDKLIVTNFHVIDGEPSPKIIFPDGSFTTPIGIIGDKSADLAILGIADSMPGLVLPISLDSEIATDEPLIAAGYALGTDLTGEPTILRGRFVNRRALLGSPVDYIQTDINLVEGMSGGPIVDQCGQVVGVNTRGLAGLSLFISSNALDYRSKDFSDAEIAKLTINTSTPEGAVEAFYTYLKARKMEDGFALLSKQYLQKTNFEEWTNRFTDILDVEVVSTEPADEGRDSVFVKFTTNNWVYDHLVTHYYEGTWQTVLEDGEYKMNKSNIKEVSNPSFDWFYTDES